MKTAHFIHKNKFSLAFFTVTVLGLAPLSSFASHTVIYGKDDRKEIYEVTNPLHAKLADSTVAMIPNDRFIQLPSTHYELKNRPFYSTSFYADDEPFLDQNTAAICSGALIAKNLVLTAGHCYSNHPEYYCKNYKLVFGYGKKTPNDNPNQISGNDVVGCKSILQLSNNDNTGDFAIIELDRDITHHEPLRLAQRSPDQNLPLNTPLVMIGHPMGLPTKIDDGGTIRSHPNSLHYLAETDSYHGNSGSPVFNYFTGEIEGILVRGETDYEDTAQGKRSKVCGPSECWGETLTKVSAILPFLPFSNRTE